MDSKRTKAYREGYEEQPFFFVVEKGETPYAVCWLADLDRLRLGHGQGDLVREPCSKAQRQGGQPDGEPAAVRGSGAVVPGRPSRLGRIFTHER